MAEWAREYIAHSLINGGQVMSVGLEWPALDSPADRRRLWPKQPEVA